MMDSFQSNDVHNYGDYIKKVSTFFLSLTDDYIFLMFNLFECSLKQKHDLALSQKTKK